MPHPTAGDAERVDAVRGGDEHAFARLVDDLSPRMLRMARVYVTDTAAAEDVVQEAWIVILRGIDRFEGRSALSSWVLGIVINVARSRSARDARSVPFSTLADDESALGPERFLPADHERWPGHWAIAPTPWPEQALETAETTGVIHAAITALPEAQRSVITLRDMIGCTAQETCNALQLTDTNQRVLLHRARTKVRAALEAAFHATQTLT